MDTMNTDFAPLLTDPKYSDLKICCEGKAFLVHRAIVCSKSAVLAKECDGGFVEAGARVIKHDVFDAATVERMIEFMYQDGYNADIIAGAPEVEEDLVPEEHDTGDHADSNTWASAFDEETSPSPSDQPTSFGCKEAILHVKVYAIADYYHVSQLKQLALQNFNQSEVYQPGEFAVVVKAIYTSTVAREDSLRETVVKQALKQKHILLSSKDFMQAVSEQPEFQPFVASFLPALLQEANSEESRLQARLDKLQLDLAFAEAEAQTLKGQNARIQESNDAKDKALMETARLTWSERQCRNCGKEFGGVLSGEEKATRLDRACFVRCRGCKCKHA